MVYGLPAYVLFICYFHCCTYVVVLIANGVFLMPFVIGEFWVGKQARSYKAASKFRNPPLFQIEWRTVQILMLNINDMFGILMVPIQCVILQLVVYCAVLLSRRCNDMHFTTIVMYIGWSIIFGGFWSMVLLGGGYLHYFTDKIVKSWKYHSWAGLRSREKRIIAKFRKSCRPLAIAFETTFVVKRLSVLKFLRKLITCILRSLLTFRTEQLR